MGVPNKFGRVNTPVYGIIPLSKYQVPVLRSYRTYRSVGYRYRARTELPEVSGSGIEFVPNFTGVFRRLLRP